MFDLSLGGPVDVGAYEGPLLEGRPLHEGSCTDGVYGCDKCNQVARGLTNEQLSKIGWSLTQHCDWCCKLVPVQKIFGLRPLDESSVYYEVCGSCKMKDNRARDEQDELEEVW